MEYPEHENLEVIKEESQIIGLFLDCLGDMNLALCKWEEGHGYGYEWVPSGYYHSNKSIEEILAEYFKIDRKKLEEEKQQMLSQFIEANNVKQHT